MRTTTVPISISGRPVQRTRDQLRKTNNRREGLHEMAGALGQAGAVLIAIGAVCLLIARALS